MIKFRTPSEADMLFLADNLRKIDVRELWLSSRDRPITAIRMGSKISEIVLAVVNTKTDKPFAIFGVSSSGISVNGRIWMLATPEIKKYVRFILEHSKKIVEEIAQNYEVVYNFVHVDNKIALRWLKWCGFTIYPSEGYGPDGALFHKIEYRRK